MNIKDFEKFWHDYTFMAAAFNEMEDFNSFLDDPECGVGNSAFDEYADEINSVIFPCF